MTRRSSLRTQSGNFWIGSFLVAEGVLATVVSLLPAAMRSAFLEAIQAHPLVLGLAIIMALLFALVTAWLGHRLGLGD